MDIKSKIESLLPGALSKGIFLASITLSILLYRFFPDLPAKYLPESEAEKFLIRILISGSILLIGSVSLASLLVHKNRIIMSELADVKETLMLLAKDTSATLKGKIKLRTDLSESNRSLANLQQEFDALKSSCAEFERLSNERKFLIDVKEKEIATLSKPVEPASASAPPDPPRRSFPSLRIPGNK